MDPWSIDDPVDLVIHGPLHGPGPPRGPTSIFEDEFLPDV